MPFLSVTLPGATIISCFLERTRRNVRSFYKTHSLVINSVYPPTHTQRTVASKFLTMLFALLVNWNSHHPSIRLEQHWGIEWVYLRNKGGVLLCLVGAQIRVNWHTFKIDDKYADDTMVTPNSSNSFFALRGLMYKVTSVKLSTRLWISKVGSPFDFVRLALCTTDAHFLFVFGTGMYGRWVGGQRLFFWVQPHSVCVRSPNSLSKGRFKEGAHTKQRLKMSELRFIVDRLNKPPFQLGLSMVRF